MPPLPAALALPPLSAALALPPLSAALAADQPWTEIPAVRILGAVIGTLLLIAAIRAMFRGRR